jgi:hypothetical protein
MGCGGSKLPTMSASARSFYLEIQSKPSIKKYGFNNYNNTTTLLKANSSSVFGGSVLLPVGAKG